MMSHAQVLYSISAALLAYRKHGQLQTGAVFRAGAPQLGRAQQLVAYARATPRSVSPCL